MDGPLRVLIVEDSEDDAELLLRELRRSGKAITYKRVDTAPAMRAALRGGKWDVVISDHKMPEFSAMAAMVLLRESGSDAPFIIVSGTLGEDAAGNAKSKFLATVSHELRTPLNAIIGFSQLIEQGAAATMTADHREYLHHVLTSSQLLLTLINDIL